MIVWFALAALVVGLMYWREGFFTVLRVATMAFIAGVAGGAIGGWL
jgi:hypothetical protein